MNKAYQLIPKPYKGLIPYSEADRLFFFGREREREIITEKLKAWNLTILYGASGIGKSSLLRAGVAYNLQQVAKKNVDETGKPGWAVIVFPPVESELAKKISWQDPLTGIKEQLKYEIARLLGVSLTEIDKRFKKAVAHLNLNKKANSELQNLSLIDTLKAWLCLIQDEEYSSKLFIILDQFEEYLVQRQPKINDSFLIEFQQAVNCSEICVNFLISIREEFLASLDCLVNIQNLFKNRRTIKHLNRESAREAIVYPLREYNRQKVILDRFLDDSPLTILAGERGSRKSTVLRLGIAYYLRRNNFNVSFFNSWHKSQKQNLLDVLKTKIYNDLDRYGAFSDSKPELSLIGTLTDTLSEWIEHCDRQKRETRLFIILDQFEEYFRQQPEQDLDRTFIDELLNVINNSSLNIKFLISIRANWLSELEDILQNRLPDSCQHYLQLNAKSEHYIQEKLLFYEEKENSKQGELQQKLEADFIKIDEGLDEYILQKFEEESQEKNRCHRNAEESDERTELEVEAPYLQLIMSRLWDEDIGIKPGDKKNIVSSNKLCKKTFETKLGGLKGIVEKHFESQISRLSNEERDIAARIFPFLVTKSGIKFALPVEDLYEQANKSQKKQLKIKEIKNLLDKLSNITSESEQEKGKENYRILHSVPGIRGEIRYEIFHDMLAEPIIAWQTDYDSKKSIEEADREKEKRIRSAKKQAELIREEGEKQANRFKIQADLANLQVKKAERQAKQASQQIEKAKQKAQIAERRAKQKAQIAERRAKQFQQQAEQNIREANREVKVAKLEVRRSQQRAKKAKRAMWLALLVMLATVYGILIAVNRTLVTNDISKTREAYRSFALSKSALSKNENARWLQEFALAGHKLQQSKLILQTIGAGSLYWDQKFSIMRILASILSQREKDLFLGEEIYPGDNQAISSLSFSPKGKQIVAGSADGKLYLWNIQDKRTKEPKILSLGKQAISSLGFSPRGKQFATGSADGKLYLWNIRDKRVKEPQTFLSNGNKKISSVSFSPKGERIVAGSADGKLHLWNIDKRVKEWRNLNLGKQPVLSLSFFSRNGKQQLATGSADGIIRLWKLKNESDNKLSETIETNISQQYKLETLNFSPDGEYFAVVLGIPSSSKQQEPALQQQIDLWDLQSRQIVYSYPLRLNTEDDEITKISFSPDNKQIAAVARNGAVKLLPIYTFDELLNEACNLLLDNKNQHKQNKACNLLDKQIENKKQEV